MWQMCDLRVADMPKRFGPAAGYSRESTTFIAQGTFSVAANPVLHQGFMVLLLLSKLSRNYFFFLSAFIIIPAALDYPFQENSSQYLLSLQPLALAPSFCARV
jgi:hypothetical protein